MSTKRNIIYNGIANIGSRLVRIADQLLLVPFFLTYWGSEYYGEWLTLSIIPSVLALSDMGFGTSASNSFVLAYASGDRQKAADVYKSGVWIVTGSVIAGVLLSALFLLIATQVGLLSKSLIPLSDVVYAVIFLMASKLVSFYLQFYDGFYRARRKAALSINLLTADGILKIVAGIVVLVLGYGVVMFAIVQFVVAVLFVSFFALYALCMVKDLPKGHYNSSDAKTIVTKGLGFMMTPIWQSIYFQGSTFAVRVVLGAEAVAVFNTVRVVCRSVNQVYSIVNNSIFPELQYEVGRNNMVLARRIFVKSVRMVFILAVLGVLLLALFGPALYAWWTKGQLAVSDTVWYLFMSGIIFNAIWWTAGCVFRAINEPHRFAIYGLACSLISVICSYLLSHTMGIAGATTGYVIMDVLMALLVLPYACKKMGVPLINIFRIKNV